MSKLVQYYCATATTAEENDILTELSAEQIGIESWIFVEIMTLIVGQEAVDVYDTDLFEDAIQKVLAAANIKRLVIVDVTGMDDWDGEILNQRLLFKDGKKAEQSATFPPLPKGFEDEKEEQQKRQAQNEFCAKMAFAMGFEEFSLDEIYTLRSFESEKQTHKTWISLYNEIVWESAEMYRLEDDSSILQCEDYEYWNTAKIAETLHEEYQYVLNAAKNPAYGLTA